MGTGADCEVQVATAIRVWRIDWPVFHVWNLSGESEGIRRSPSEVKQGMGTGFDWCGTLGTGWKPWGLDRMNRMNRMDRMQAAALPVGPIL
jgi:hypothetical protein